MVASLKTLRLNNIMNTTTIQYIQDNYKLILKTFKNFSSRENIEDAISNLYIQLTKRDYNITNPKQFVSGAVANFVNKGRRNQWRSVPLDYTNEPFAPCIIEQIDEEQEQNSRLRLMQEKIQELPLKQKEALKNYFKYGKTSLVPGNRNTNKMNFRWAVLALKGKLLNGHQT